MNDPAPGGFLEDSGWQASPGFELKPGVPWRSLLGPPLRPGTLGSLERFAILELIGGGGMGLVFLAHDPSRSLPGFGSQQGRVAIKILRPELLGNAQAERWFKAEARHMGRLDHPNILPILEVTERSGAPFFVTPYIESGSLAKRLQDGKPLGLGMVVRVGREIAGALQFAHARGVIHRDLKPANILLDTTGKAYLADFGLARTLFHECSPERISGPCAGTAPYMSPCLAAGEVGDTRGDIYSLGAVLYEMLTGRPPYVGESNQEIVQKILKAPPTPIRDLNPAAPPGLVQIAERAMARSLRDRYAQIADVLDELERFEAAPPPSPAT